jgi:hypothetical protein
MRTPYEYFRFRWWHDADLWKVSRILSSQFDVEWIFMPSYNRTKFTWAGKLVDNIKAIAAYLFPSVQKLWVSDWLKVKADTLTAYLFPLKALLFQKEYKPFTNRDMELRRKVLELYPYNRSSLISFGLVNEPKIPLAS